MNYDGYGELGLIRIGLLLLNCSYFERIMFMGYGLWEAHGNGSVLFFPISECGRHRYGHVISGVYALLSSQLYTFRVVLGVYPN